MADEQRFVVMGVRFDDNVSAQAASKVVAIAVTQALLAFTAGVLSFFINFPLGFGLIPAVILPLLGYCGVLQRARWATVAYLIISLVMALVYVISVIVTFAAVGDYIGCVCSASCATSHGLPAGDASVCNNVPRARTLFYTALALGLMMSALQLAGARFAYVLLRLRFFEPLLAQTFAPQMVPLRAAPSVAVHGGGGSGGGSGDAPLSYATARSYTYSQGVATYAAPRVPTPSAPAEASLVDDTVEKAGG